MSTGHSITTACVTCRATAVTVFVTTLFTAMASLADAPDGHRQYWSIRMRDNIIGYAWSETESRRENGQPINVMTCRTELKMTLLGKVRRTSLDAVTTFNSAGDLVRYRGKNRTNDTVIHVEVEVNGGHAKLWSYREGAQRGAPKELVLPEHTRILGSNIFGHWSMILSSVLEAKTDRVKVPVLVADAQQLDTLELVKGSAKPIKVRGHDVAAVPWKIETADVVLWSAPNEPRLLRLELPSQETVIASADESVVKLFEKAQVEELLAKNFAQSNVKFDDMLSVTRMTADVDVNVIGSGVENPASVLATIMQTFHGTKQGPHIRGKVEVTTKEYDTSKSPDFPSPPQANMSDWLRPEPLIESDDPKIIEQATQLTKGCQTRWAAVDSIGGWVHQNIRYAIADSPSARLALDKKVGDCGPHATLMVAMLRSVGVPSRLVGGVVYTPSFGGSFGQHAWVEVHMGEAGWLPMDPTTGEFHKLSATHIKFFEGMGGVIPKRIEVLSYQPPNRAVAVAPPSLPRPLPWKTNRSYIYRYKQGGSELGTERFIYSDVEQDGSKSLLLKSELKLTVGGAVEVTSSAMLRTQRNGAPLEFAREFKSPQQVRIQATFEDGKVTETISGAQNLKRTIDLPERGCFCFDNNLTSSFATICSQLEWKQGRAVRIDTFHPSSLQLLALTITPVSEETIDVAGKKTACWKCEVAPINNTFWIAKDGRLVRVTQANIEITLEEPAD